MLESKVNNRWADVTRFWPELLLLLLIVAVYVRSFGHPWIYDDIVVVVENSDIRSLLNFLENSYAGRPLRELSYMLDYLVFGLNPAGYHVQNLFWHTLNAVLVFRLAVSLGMERLFAVFAAALFALHPLQVEVVSNIGHRKDALVLAFMLLALAAWRRGCHHEGTNRLMWLTAAGGLATVAFLAKENALILPLLFILYEFIFVPRERRCLTRQPSYFALVTGVAVLSATVWLILVGRERYLEAAGLMMVKMNHLSAVNLGDYGLMVVKSWGFIFLRLVFPVDLAPEYTFDVPKSFGDPWVIATLAVIAVAASISMWLWRRGERLLPFALGWFALCWIPVSNLWPSSYFAADRYLYAPLVGFSLLAAWGVSRLGQNVRVQVVIAVSLLILLGGLTWQQDAVWSSHYRLWEKAVAVSPASTWALNNLGVVYMEQKRYPEALELFLKAAKNFNEPLTLRNLGWAYEKLGDQRSSVRYYQSFIAMNDPRYQREIGELRRRLGSGNVR